MGRGTRAPAIRWFDDHRRQSMGDGSGADSGTDSIILEMNNDITERRRAEAEAAARAVPFIESIANAPGSHRHF